MIVKSLFLVEGQPVNLPTGLDVSDTLKKVIPTSPDGKCIVFTDDHSMIEDLEKVAMKTLCKEEY